MKLVEYPDAEMMAIDLADVLASDLRVALTHAPRATFVVPGGTSPGPIFDILCAVDLDWSRIDVILSDERWLPEVHVRSNTRLIKERLLVNRAAAAVYHPLYAKTATPEDVLPELEAGLLPYLPISVLLLGMGGDMHTASIFPKGDNLKLALKRKKSPVLVPMRVDGMDEARISFSARILNAAMSKHVVISGIPKRNAIEKARYLEPKQAPITAVLDGATVHWAP